MISKFGFRKWEKIRNSKFKFPNPAVPVSLTEKQRVVSCPIGPGVAEADPAGQGRQHKINRGKKISTKNKSKKLLAVVPARGGSKEIPGKNIKILAGLPLIVWTINEAKKSKFIDRLIVSTEDKKIASVAKKYGAEVPFLRPKNLSRDTTPGVEPILHACSQFPEFEEVICLQPTSPLRRCIDIDGLVLFARKRSAVSVVSVSPASEHPAWTFHLGKNRFLKPFLRSGYKSSRQQLKDAYCLNGAIYYAKISWLQKEKKFISSKTLGYIMPVFRSLDIDKREDFLLANWIVTRE